MHRLVELFCKAEPVISGMVFFAIVIALLVCIGRRNRRGDHDIY